MKMRNLLIDDVRTIQYIENDYGIKVQYVARTFAEGIAMLKNHGPFDILLLDHDLASYDENGTELTGYSIMLFLEENPEFTPKDIVFVTSNPVGRAKMQVVADKLFKSEFEE